MNVRGLILGFALCSLIGSSVLAQDGPGPGGRPPRPEGQEGRGRGPEGDRDRGPGGDHDRGPGMGMEGGGFGRGDSMDGGMLPPQMRMFQGYMMMIEQSARMSRDPSASGVAAAVMAGDLLRKKGPEAGIEYYTKLLPDIKDPTIERAVRFQLIELYKRTKQEDKALSELTRMITGAPTTKPSQQ